MENLRKSLNKFVKGIKMNDLYKVVSEVFEIDIKGIKDEYGPDDIEKWDSIGQLSLISSLESHYRTTFEIEEIFEIFTVADIKVLLANRGIK